MQTESVTNIRYPESRRRFFLNFVLSLWFENRVLEVQKEGKPDRIKRYAAMDPYEMVIEAPLVFDKASKKFRSCIVDRKAGTLLVDQLIPQVNLETFIERSEKSDNVNTDGDYSQSVADIVSNGITLADVVSLIHQPELLSKDPIFYLTKVKDTDEYVILYDHTVDDPNFDDMVSWIFRDYTFESIVMEISEEGESGYPNVEGNAISDFYTGKVILTDSLLTENSITFNFLDLKQLNTIVEKVEMAIVVGITGNDPFTISDLASTTPVVADKLVVSTSRAVDKSKLIIKRMFDELGVDISEGGSFDISRIDGVNYAGSLSMKDYPFKFGFVHPEGYRRKVGVEIGIADANNSSQTAEVPIDYKVSTLTPEFLSATLDEETGNEKVSFELALVDSEGKDVSSLLPQKFESDYDPFLGVAEVFEVTNAISAPGLETTVGTSESGRPVIKFDASVSGYGNFRGAVKDEAIAEFTGSIAEPVDEYSLIQENVTYNFNKLEITHALYKNGNPFSILNGKFEESKVPKITIDGQDYTPTFTWDKNTLVLLYSFGKEVKSVVQELKSEFLLGLNKWPITFDSEITVLPEITSVSFPTGELLDYSSDYKYVIGKAAIVQTNIKGMEASDIELVRLRDASGRDITNNATLSVTAANDDGDTFITPISLTGYDFPMSFENPNGPDGQMDVELQVKDFPDTVSTGKYGYKLTRPTGSIRPWVVYIKLGDSGKDDAIIQVGFLDAVKNTRINNGVNQVLPNTVALYGEGDNQLTYLGDEIKYSAGELGYYVANIPTKIDHYGNFTLLFADNTFLTDLSSVADPASSYELRPVGSSMDAEKKQIFIKYELYKDGERYTIRTGKTGKLPLTLKSNGQTLLTGIGWTYDGVDSALLTLSGTITDTTVDQNYTVVGNFYIGGNLVPIGIDDSGTIAGATAEN